MYDIVKKNLILIILAIIYLNQQNIYSKMVRLIYIYVENLYIYEN